VRGAGRCTRHREDGGSPSTHRMPYIPLTKVTREDVSRSGPIRAQGAGTQRGSQPNPLVSVQCPPTGNIHLDLINFSPGCFNPNPAKSGCVDRGAYLVEARFVHLAEPVIHRRTSLACDRVDKPCRAHCSRLVCARSDRGCPYGICSWSTTTVVAILRPVANSFRHCVRAEWPSVLRTLPSYDKRSSAIPPI